MYKNEICTHIYMRNTDVNEYSKYVQYFLGINKNINSISIHERHICMYILCIKTKYVYNVRIFI